MKTFIFGRHPNDPKGPPEEHGEVHIDAPSIVDARAEFVKRFGDKEPRFPIVRVDAAAELAKASTATAKKPKRARRS